MDFVAASSKLGDDVLRQKFGVAAGHIDIHIVFAKIAIEHWLKSIQQLYLVKKQILHLFAHYFWTDICHEFFWVYAFAAFLQFDKALTD